MNKMFKNRKGQNTVEYLLMLAVVVGVVLVAEGFDHHVPKGYIYFGMAFSLAVEMLNIRLRRNAAKPVALRPPRMPGSE